MHGPTAVAASATLNRALPRVDRSDGVDRVRVLGALVGAVALHAREAQGDAARIATARLRAVEGDLDDEFGAHVDDESSLSVSSSSSRYEMT